MIMTNCRHISLLPSISKIIEKVAHNQISYYSTSHFQYVSLATQTLLGL